MTTEQLSELSPILGAVEQERQRQILKGYNADHDADRSTADFVRIIKNYAGWADQMDYAGSPNNARTALIRVAALAVAAVEALDARKAGRTRVPR